MFTAPLAIWPLCNCYAHMGCRGAMITVILLLVVSIVGLTVIIKLVVTPKYGEDVHARFFERLNYIPSQKPQLLSQATLTAWLADPEHDRAKHGYVYPVLFPLDFVFLLSLGAFLELVSVSIADRVSFLSGIPTIVWWVFPALYVVADGAEDTLAAGIFKSIIPLTRRSYSLLRKLTAIKLAAVSMAIGQAGFLSALAVLLYLLYLFPVQQ